MLVIKRRASSHVAPLAILYVFHNVVVPGKKGKGTVEPLMEVFHGTATECHLPYGITQCYLPPNISEHTPP